MVDHIPKCASRRNLSALPVRPSKLAHVVVRTTKLAETRSWYLTVLGAEVAFENDDVVFLRYDDEHHRIGIVRMPDASAVDPGTEGVDHVGFTFAELGELLATYLRLKDEGIVPFWPIIHGPTVSLYYRDPNGVKLELQYDVLRTAEEVDQFIADNYAENFMGVIFDPDDMVRRYEAGEPLASLTKRPPLPPGLGPWDMIRP